MPRAPVESSAVCQPGSNSQIGRLPKKLPTAPSSTGQYAWLRRQRAVVLFSFS